MANPNILLSGRPAQIDSPLESEARGLSFQQMAQATKLNDMKIREADQRQRDLDEDRQDEQVIQKAFVDNAGDHEKMRSAVAPKVRLRNLQKWDADHLKAQQGALGLANEQRIALQTQNQLSGSEIAGLYQLPYEQRKRELPNALARLQKSGIDTSRFEGVDPNDDNLQYLAGTVNYIGSLLSTADKEARTAELKEKASRDKEAATRLREKADEDVKQRKIEDATRKHLGVTNQEQHNQWLSGLDAEIRPLFENLKTFDKSAQTTVQRVAMNSKERQADIAREQAEKDRSEAAQDRREYYKDANETRRLTAESMAAFRRESLALKESQQGGRKLTGNALKTEERNINAIEYGTPTRKGLHAKLLEIGTMLDKGKNAKDEDLSDSARALLTSEYEAAQNNLQQTQFRKADLYGIEKPETVDVDAAGDKDEITTENGAIWKKKNGVAFFQRMTGTEPTQSTTKAPTSGKGPAVGGQSAKPAETKAPSQSKRKVGDVVTIKGKQYKIKQLLPNGQFEADPVGQ